MLTSQDMHPGTVDEAVGLLARARQILVVTGAGISAPSGIPTFRGGGGYWSGLDPQTVSSLEGFRRNPLLAWQWYHDRRAAAMAATPNRAHLALARLAAERSGIQLVTQNVDGLHERAAALLPVEMQARAAPIALHGTLFAYRCISCGRSHPGPGSQPIVALQDVPTCPTCHELIRPAITWFGEVPELTDLHRSMDAARTADACLVIGTSATVRPAASLPLLVRSHGGLVIEINTNLTVLTPACACSLRGSAEQLVGDVVDAISDPAPPDQT
jgi:NAD-dependent deacetylase